MSRWTEELKNHPIRDTFKNIKTHLSTKFENTDRNRDAEKRRLLLLVRQYVSVLNKLPADLAPISQIDDLNNYLRGQVASYTESYSRSGSALDLENANNQMTVKLAELGILRSFIGDIAEPGQIAQLNEFANEFTDNLKTKIDEFGGELTKFQTDLGTLKTNKEQLDNNFETKKKEVDDIARQFQSTFTGSQETRAEKAKEEADKLEVKIENRFEELHGAHKKELETIVVDAKSADKKLREESLKALNDLISDSKEKYDNILKLHGLVATGSVAVGYSKNADDERKQADQWRKYSVCFIVAAAGWLFSVSLYSLLYSLFLDSIGLAWTWYLSVFSLTIVLSGGAAYAAQQSAKHRMNEKRDRQRHLQLKAFDPFIGSLDGETQKELKKELAEKMFGNDGQETEPGNEHTMTSVVKMVIDIMKAAK